MQRGTYIRKRADGYEFGFLNDSWRCTGRLPYAGIYEYVLIGSDHEPKGVVPSYAAAQAAVAALS